jgi:hypothetical protein
MATIASSCTSCQLAEMTSYADVASLDRHQQHLRKLKQKEKRAIAALEQLRHEHHIRRQDSNDDYESDAVRAKDISRSNHSKNFSEDEILSDSQDSVQSGTSSEHENIVESVLSDYDMCLGRLKVMQMILEIASRKLSPANAECSTARARQSLAREVDENTRQTLLCLKRHISKSVSHRRIMRGSGHGARRTSAQTRAQSPLSSHGTMEPGTGKLSFRFSWPGSDCFTGEDSFMDALEYQSDVVEHDNPCAEFERCSEGETAVFGGTEPRNRQVHRDASVASNRQRMIEYPDAKRQYAEEVAAVKTQLELDSGDHTTARTFAEVGADAGRRHDSKRESLPDIRAAADVKAASSLKLELQARGERRDQDFDDEHYRRQQENEEATSYGEALRKQKREAGPEERQYQETLHEESERYKDDESAKREEQVRIDYVVRTRLENLGYSRNEVDRVLSFESASGDLPKPPPFRYQPMPFMQSQIPIVLPPAMMAPPARLDAHALRAQRLGEPILALGDEFDLTPPRRHWSRSRDRFYDPPYFPDEMFELDLRRHRSYTRDRFAVPPYYRGESEHQRREANGGVRRRRNNEAFALGRYVENAPRKEEARAAEAERIREKDADALEPKANREAQDLSAAEARRGHNVKSVVPELELKLLDKSLRQHASERSTRSEKARHSESNVRTDDDSSESTANDDIEVLVREWTNLYDQDSTTVLGAAAEQDSGIEEAFHTSRVTQSPQTARMTSRRVPVYVEVLPDSHISSSIGSGRSANERHHRSPQGSPTNHDNLETSPDVEYVD